MLSTAYFFCKFLFNNETLQERNIYYYSGDQYKHFNMSRSCSTLRPGCTKRCQAVVKVNIMSSDLFGGYLTFY
jgi:hypothetical protein